MELTKEADTVLDYLYHHQDKQLTTEQIADDIDLPAETVQDLLDELEQYRLIRTTMTSSDSTYREVALTEDGKRAVEMDDYPVQQVVTPHIDPLQHHRRTQTNA